MNRKAIKIYGVNHDPMLAERHGSARQRGFLNRASSVDYQISTRSGLELLLRLVIGNSKFWLLLRDDGGLYEVRMKRFFHFFTTARLLRSFYARGDLRFICAYFLSGNDSDFIQASLLLPGILCCFGHVEYLKRSFLDLVTSELPMSTYLACNRFYVTDCIF